MGPAESDAVNQPLPGHLELTVEPAQGVEIPLAPFFQHAARRGALELVDDLLAPGRGHRAVDGPQAPPAQILLDLLEGLEEEGEHDHLAAVLGGLLHDLLHAPGLAGIVHVFYIKGHLPHRREVIESIAAILGVEENQIFVKAKTGEKLPPVGTSEAVEAQVVCLLEN